MQETQILVARQGPTAYVQVQGRGSFKNAGAMKSFYLEMLGQGLRQFVFDLEKCSYMDSTFMGTLAGLGSKLKPEPEGSVKIVNVNERNLELLQNLGLDRVINISLTGVDFHQPKPDELAPATTPELSKSELNAEMLEAHETLTEIDPANAPKFKDVLAYLKEDLGKSSSD